MKWNGEINWSWFKSIIDEYKSERVSREKFIADWQSAQETMKTVRSDK